MAISLVASRSNVATAAGGASYTGVVLATGSAITPGNTLVMEMAYRDAATPPTDARPQPGEGSLGSIAVDLRGNLWRRVAVAVNPGATDAADNGAIAAIWVCHVVFPYSDGDILTITAPVAAAPMTAIAIRVLEWSGIRRNDEPIQQYSYFGNGTATVAAGIQPTAAGQLVYGVVSVATGPALTGDGDATDGTWTAISQGTSPGAIVRGTQMKTVTGTAAQSWDVTWTGTQRWAAAVAVFEEATVPWPQNNERLANPNYPCPSGPEIIPVALTYTPIDTGTAQIFETDLPTESRGTSSVYWSADFSSLDPTVDVQHALVAEVYERGNELLRATPVTLDMGVPYAATLQGGATTTGGGTAVDALAAAGGEQVVLETGQSVDCWWDFTQLIPYVGRYRVLNLSINYVAWKDDSAALEPGEGLAVYWRDETAVRRTASSRVTSLHGAWLVNDYQTTAKRVYKNLGEINGLPQIGATSDVQYADLAACFTLNDLIRMNSGDQSTMLSIRGLSGSAPSQEQVFLDTIRLEVTIVPEKRLAQSARRVSSGVGFPDGLVSVMGKAMVPLYEATDTELFWTTPEEYTPISVILREGLPASPSDWFAAQYDPTNIPLNLNGGVFRYASQERVGPSAAVATVVQPRETLEPQVVVKRAAWTDGQIAPNAVPERRNEDIHSFTLYDLNSYQGFWPMYSFVNVLDEGVSVGSPGLSTLYTPGDITFDDIKLIVKAPDDPDAPDLTFSVEFPLTTVLATATLTRAEVLALPEIAEGYREVHVPLSTSITPATPGSVFVLMDSNTPDTDPWVLAVGVDQGAPAFSTYMDGRSSYQADPTLAPTTVQDIALVLCCPIPDVDAEIATQEITIPSNDSTCVVAPSNIPCLTINNATDYDWLEITRIIAGLDFRSIALLDVAGELTYPTITATDDFERTEASGWGDATLGGTWDVSDAADFEVASGAGLIDSTAGSAETAILSTTYTAMSVEGTVALEEIPSGGDIRAGIMARAGATPAAAAANNYRIQAEWQTNGTVLIRFRSTVGGVASAITTLATLPSYTLGQKIRLKISVIDTLLQVKWWLDGSTEPDWQASGSISNFASGTAGVYYERAAGNTSTNFTAYYDDFEVSDFVEQSLTFCDYGVPWDLDPFTISYEITGYRDSDRRTTTSDEIFWEDTSVSPGAAFGIATEDGLYAYVPGSESGELQVTWSPLTPIESLPLAGQDYQIALRPAENRGLAVTVNVIVDNIAKCVVAESGESGIYDESLPYDSIGLYDYPNLGIPAARRGRYSLAPTPFTEIQELHRHQRVELKLPGGHTRFVYFDVGAMVIIPVIGQYMAEITLVDTPPPTTDPWA